jgi:NAD(P)-dependent dehydrogenase (short-subunit alcohol dehydrogenase family)
MITSPYASRPNAKGGTYVIGKASQEEITLTLSKELKGTGVTANLQQVKTIDKNHEELSSPTIETATWTTPEELTKTIIFLLAEEAGTINGSRIPLFGAYS